MKINRRLPPEFIEAIVTGWRITCIEILPHKERASGGRQGLTSRTKA